MDKTYQPHEIESRWYAEWEAQNYFAPQGSGESYTIALPPPNVTGSLHMGHGFNNAIMDALEAHTTMSSQALGSERVRDGLKDVLLGPGQLYEALRARANPSLTVNR